MFGMGKQQYLLLSDDRFASVDLSDRLGAVADEGGNEFSPLGPGSVSPDGTQVFFRQPGRVEVWDLARNSWRTVETADVESRRVDPRRHDRHARGRRATGPVGPRRPRSGRSRSRVRTARRPSWTGWPRERARRRRASPTHYANPEFLAAGTPDAPDLLAFGMGRSKMCCVPMAWFSHDFVLFAASDPDGAHRVLAWRVGTPDVYRVSDYIDFRPGTSRRAGPRTPSASRGAR